MPMRQGGRFASLDEMLKLRSVGSVMRHYRAAGRFRLGELSRSDFYGPDRRLLRDNITSEIGGKAEMAGARSKRRW
jgi:hypothetical protein